MTMKPKFVFFISLLFLALLNISCSSSVENWIKFQNMASNDVYVNFRANLIQVKSGDTVILSEIAKGTYDYETIYEIPAGATTSGTQGETAGEFVIKAGTKVLVVYTSTFIEGNYTLYASVTTSEDIDDTDPNPIGP